MNLSFCFFGFWSLGWLFLFLFQEIEVNLIITDYCMPGMTGYDLLKRVKVFVVWSISKVSFFFISFWWFFKFKFVWFIESGIIFSERYPSCYHVFWECAFQDQQVWLISLYHLQFLKIFYLKWTNNASLSPTNVLVFSHKFRTSISWLVLIRKNIDYHLCCEFPLLKQKGKASHYHKSKEPPHFSSFWLLINQSNLWRNKRKEKQPHQSIQSKDLFLFSCKISFISLPVFCPFSFTDMECHSQMLRGRCRRVLSQTSPVIWHEKA